MVNKSNGAGKIVALKQKMLSASIAAIVGTSATATLLTPASAQEDELEEIIVTGTRIIQRDFTANSPIVSMESQFFENTSTFAIETQLNQLPQFVPAVTQFVTTEVQNSPTVTAGANTIDLRGLGVNRSLTLLDGRRSQPVNALLSVDTNTLPAAAIERVEIVTGGASATYGADAIAGVVNFILKRDFEGIELDVQTGTTDEGDGEETRVATLFGANFEGGRGNVMLGLEFADRKVATRAGREFYEKGWVDPTVNGTQFFQSNTYYLNSFANPVSQAAVDRLFPQSAPGTVPLNQEFFFNRGDQTVYQADDPEGALNYTDGFEPTAANGYADRKLRDDGTIDENQPFSYVSTPLKRYSLFGAGRYEVTDDIEVYAQGNFVQTSTNTLLLYSPAVTIWNATIPYGNDLYGPSLGPGGATNPDYLPGGSVGVNCAPTGGCTQSEAFPVPPDLAALLDSRPNPDADWNLNRVMDFIGPRRTENNSRMFQLTTGLTGGIDAIDGTWDIYYTHGETDTESNLLGFGDLTNWRNMVGAANYGRGAVVPGQGVGAGTGRCTSGFPIFGNFEVSQDCIDAVTADMVDQTFLSQDIAELTVQGLVTEMPAGELRFAAGASYRENEFAFDVAHLNDANNTSTQAIGLFASNSTTGATDVSEAFVEFAVPILADAGFVESLSLELGARYSDYSIGEEVTTWKALFDLTVSDRFRLRGGAQRANRAPNIGELFAPANQSVEGTAFGDACNADNTTAPFGANPATNPDTYQHAQQVCSALMGPEAAAVWFGTVQGGGLPGITLVWESGNPNLTSEEADTVTFGVVFALENIDLSVDWYSIELNDAVGPAGYDTTYEQCLSPQFNPSGDPNNPFCRNITRDPIDGGQQRVDVSQANLGVLSTEGVDFQLDWITELSGGASIGFSTLASILGEFITQDLPTAPLLDSAGTGREGGQFDYRIFNTLNYFRGDLSLALRHRHYPSIDHASIVINPATTTRGAESYDIFDFNGLYRFNDRYQVRFGIDNLLDEDPVIYGATPTSSAQGSTLSGYYDTLGRRMYVGFKAEF